MFVELGSEVSVDDLLKGMIVLSAMMLRGRRRGLAGSEEAFAERMNKRRASSARTAACSRMLGLAGRGPMTTARDLALIAWHTIQDYPQYYPHYAQPTGPTTASSRTTATACSRSRRYRRAEDRPHGRGRLRPGGVGDS